MADLGFATAYFHERELKKCCSGDFFFCVCIWMCCMKPLESHGNHLFLSLRREAKAVQKHSAFH